MDENVKIIVSAVDKASRDLQKIGKAGKTSFTEMKSAIDMAKDSFRDVLSAAKKVYDLGKEGARLETVAGKFDKLSASIGTTSDILKKDLRAATNGLIADSELVASATDLMTLGLVKTHDEAVRLTKIAGTLGMDMSQLVLTMTNQTTMRFDALGISVDGFDKKVKALEETGLSASEAFNEAFLQQAEEQIKNVGDVANTSEGQFRKWEAEIKNAADALKMELVPSIMTMTDAVMTAAKADGGLIDDLMELINWIERNTYVTNVLNEAYEKNLITTWERTRAGSFLFGSEEKNLEQVEEIEKKLKAYNVRAADAAMRSRGLGRAASESASGVEELGDATNDTTTDVSNHAAALAIAVGAYVRAQEAAANAKNRMDEFRSSTQMGRSELEALNNMQPNFASTIQAEIDKIDWKMLGGEEVQYAFDQIGLALDEGLDPEKAKGALGEVEVAALGLQAKMDGLTVDELAKNIQNELGGSLAEAKVKAEEVMAAIEAGTLKEYLWQVRVEFNYVNPPKEGTWLPPNATPPVKQNPPSKQHAAGGIIGPGELGTVGEAGWEIVQGLPGGGARVFSNPQSQNMIAPVIGGDTYITNNIYQLPGEDTSALAARVVAMLSRGGRRGAAGLGYAGA